MPVKSPPTPQGQLDLTVNCELCRSAVVSTTQVRFISIMTVSGEQAGYENGLFSKDREKIVLIVFLYSCADGEWRCLHVWLRPTWATRAWRC